MSESVVHKKYLEWCKKWGFTPNADLQRGYYAGWGDSKSYHMGRDEMYF